MAVFISASDESDGGHHRSTFWHAGWIPPETDWSAYFTQHGKSGCLMRNRKSPFFTLQTYAILTGAKSTA
jgi:hypothetical protein